MPPVLQAGNISHFLYVTCSLLSKDPETFDEIAPERERNSAEVTKQEGLEKGRVTKARPHGQALKGEVRTTVTL